MKHALIETVDNIKQLYYVFKNIDMILFTNTVLETKT